MCTCVTVIQNFMNGYCFESTFSCANVLGLDTVVLMKCALHPKFGAFYCHLCIFHLLRVDYLSVLVDYTALSCPQVQVGLSDPPECGSGALHQQEWN